MFCLWMGRVIMRRKQGLCTDLLAFTLWMGKTQNPQLGDCLKVVCSVIASNGFLFLSNKVSRIAQHVIEKEGNKVKGGGCCVDIINPQYKG